MISALASVDWTKTIPAIGSALVALATLVRFVGGPSRTHTRLTTETEILARLIPGTDLHDAMSDIVRKRIAELSGSRKDTRDIPMFVVALIAAPALTYAAIWFVQQNTWWGWLAVGPTVFFAIIFVYGIFETAEAVPRDAFRTRIEY